MSVVTVIGHRLLALFLGILGLFKRALCFLRRRRKNSGTLLPTTNHYPISVTQSVPGNEVELESWDNWGQDTPSAVSVVENMANGGTNSNNVFPGNRGKKDVAPEPEPDIDFFQDMAPDFKKQTRILVRKKEQHSGGISSRLAMASELPAQNPDLDTWEETENAWEEGIAEDLSWEAEAAIKEKRRQERERRTLEHQKKKMERESQRLSKKDSVGHLAAVKLS